MGGIRRCKESLKLKGSVIGSYQKLKIKKPLKNTIVLIGKLRKLLIKLEDKSWMACSKI